MPTIAQITDSHLFCDLDTELRGCKTGRSFELVWKELRRNRHLYDLLILTGDFAHDEEARTYAYLREKVDSLEVPYCLIPGNHDHRQNLISNFTDKFENLETLRFVEKLGSFTLIGLDSQVEGETWGELGQEQLKWLNEAFKCCGNNLALIFVHHHPISIGHEYMDNLMLRDADQFFKTLRGHSQIKAIFTGHVHGEFETSREEIPVFGTPSTCFQLDVQQEKFAPSQTPPGYRVIKLGENGSVDSQVHWVQP